MRERGLYAPTRAQWAGCSTDISSDGHVPTHAESANGVLRIQDHDKVRDVCTDLKPPAHTSRGNA